MAKSKFFVVGLMLMVQSVFAQVNRYMVFFKDKNGSAFSVDAPNAFLSQRAIDRRTKQGIAIMQQDIPVNNDYIQGVKNTGATTFFPTRWMNGVLVQCDASLIASIKALAFVDHVDLVAPGEKLISSGRKKTNHRSKGAKSGEVTDAQLHQLGMDQMQADGYRGENIIIAIFDGGFPGVNTAAGFEHIFNDNKIDLTSSHDFVYNSDNVFQYDEHGTEVLSVISGYVENSFTGGAFKANFQLYVTEDSDTEYRIEEYNWLFAAERADSAGADVVNSSLGYYDFDDNSMNYTKSDMDGKTAVVTRAAQMLADRGVVIVCAAGNEGTLPWQIVTAPADAVDVLAVGSVDDEGTHANSSSKGPTADGRIKPDVSAMGVRTSVIIPNGGFSTVSGTSLASPLIASFAAGIWEKYPDLSNKEVMSIIRKSSSRAKSPDNLLGYGIPNYKSVDNYLKYLEENPFEIYPVPFLDSITLSPFNPLTIGECDVEMISAQGRILWNRKHVFSRDAPVLQLNNLTDLPAGMYILKVGWSGKTLMQKVMKQ